MRLFIAILLTLFFSLTAKAETFNTDMSFVINQTWNTGKFIREYVSFQKRSASTADATGCKGESEMKTAFNLSVACTRNTNITVEVESKGDQMVVIVNDGYENKYLVLDLTEATATRVEIGYSSTYYQTFEGEDARKLVMSFQSIHVPTLSKDAQRFMPAVHAYCAGQDMTAIAKKAFSATNNWDKYKHPDYIAHFETQVEESGICNK